jgi:hypothetical protein
MAFQACIQGISKVGFSLSRVIIGKLFDYFKSKVKNLTPPLVAPFATVTQWMLDIPATAKEFFRHNSPRSIQTCG